MLEMAVHVFATGAQKATRFKVPGLDFWFKYKPRALLCCHNCRKWRWASNLLVFAYYDEHIFVCRKGKGCTVKP